MGLILSSDNKKGYAMSTSTDVNTLRPALADVGVHRSRLLEDEAVCALYKALEARNGLNTPVLHGISLAYSFGSASPSTMRNMGLGGQVQELPLRSKMILLTLSMAFCDAQDTDVSLQKDVLDYIVTFRNLVQDAWNEDEAIVEKAERELAKDVAYVIAFGIISYANLSYLVEQNENECSQCKARCIQADNFLGKHLASRTVLGKHLASRTTRPHDEEVQTINWIMRAVKVLCHSLSTIAC